MNVARRRPARAATALLPVLLPILVLGAAAGCTNEPVRAGTGPATTTATTATTTSTATTVAARATSTTTPPIAAIRLDAGADLYADPPSLTSETQAGTTPGTLLRYQPLDDELEAGRPGTLWRVMYVSTDDDGRPIPVTGTIRVPDDRPMPTDGWPVIAWAHGTTGTADQCASSLHRRFPPVPDPLVADGFVIASTDYAGLGTPGLHPYLDGPSEGRSVLDIVTAVGGLPGVRPARPFVVWGHSQGGHAALFAREMAAERLPDHDLVGTISIASPALIADTMTAMLHAMQPKGFAAMTMAAIAAKDPAARLTDILVPDAAAAIESVVETGCATEVDRALVGFGRTDIVTNPPNSTEPWATHLAAAEPANEPGTGPLLLIHAADDATVPAVMSATVKARVCGRGEPVQRWLTAFGGHNGVIGETWNQMRSWTLDRFAGVAAPTNCGVDDGPPPA